MDKKTRKQAEKSVGPLYRRFGSDFGSCWYCGDQRQCYDHCPPIAYVFGSDLKALRKSGIELLLVPSCLECNATLGADKSLTPIQRIAALYAAYAKKIESVASLWSPEELSEMGYNLRKEIEKRQMARHSLIEKLRKVEGRLLSVK